MATRNAMVVVDVFYHTGGSLGINVLDCSAPFVEAFNLMRDGAAWAIKHEQRPKS